MVQDFFEDYGLKKCYSLAVDECVMYKVNTLLNAKHFFCSAGQVEVQEEEEKEAQETRQEKEKEGSVSVGLGA